MSFSSNVKDELLKHVDTARHCNLAALSAVINLCGIYSADKNNAYVIIRSENTRVTAYAIDLIFRLFQLECEEADFDGKPAVILHGSQAASLLSATGFCGRGNRAAEEPINPLIVAMSCCKRAYLKAAFICCGSVTNPEKAYHFELVNEDYYHAHSLKELVLGFGIEPKIIERKNHYVLYLKEGEQIVDMLNLISAHNALMEYENKRILKEVRNNVNRKVNCETANINKVVLASVRQREAIEYIQNTVGFSYLSDQLEEIARVRLDNPSLSLKELGEMLNPPVGKSGVNHRLKKICEIAEYLKGDNKDG